MGLYAERIGVADSATLGLQACRLARTPGKMLLGFVDVGHLAHPDVGSPERFPFWNRARQHLCPQYRQGR